MRYKLEERMSQEEREEFEGVMEKIGKCFQDARIAQKKKQNEVAEAIGVTRNMMGRYEYGKGLSVLTINKLCEYYSLFAEEVLATAEGRKNFGNKKQIDEIQARKKYEALRCKKVMIDTEFSPSTQSRWIHKKNGAYGIKSIPLSTYFVLAKTFDISLCEIFFDD